jgi:hypothetical protein
MAYRPSRDPSRIIPTVPDAPADPALAEIAAVLKAGQTRRELLVAAKKVDGGEGPMARAVSGDLVTWLGKRAASAAETETRIVDEGRDANPYWRAWRRSQGLPVPFMPGEKI